MASPVIPGPPCPFSPLSGVALSPPRTVVAEFFQERVGEYVKEVIPASTLGFLPTPPLDLEQRTLATNDRPRLLAKQTNLDSGSNAPATNPILVTGRPLGEGNGGTAEDEMEERVEGGREVDPSTTLALLKKMIHLFRHGTHLSLELELKAVGAEALRVLRTPDVSMEPWWSDCSWLGFTTSWVYIGPSMPACVKVVQGRRRKTTSSLGTRFAVDLSI